jgi:hypothetical protein
MQKHLAWKTFAVWKTTAEELAWPYRLDLVDLGRAPKEFLQVIETQMRVLHGTWYEPLCNIKAKKFTGPKIRSPLPGPINGLTTSRHGRNFFRPAMPESMITSDFPKKNIWKLPAGF